MTRHWAINGRFLSQPLTGVQRYGAEVVRALDELLCSGRPLGRNLAVELLVPPDAITSLNCRAIRTRVIPGGHGHFWEQVLLPSQVTGGLVSLCNTGPLRVRRQVLCIHDANTRVAPSSYSRAFRAMYGVLQPVLSRRVSQVTTVSYAAASQLVTHKIVREPPLVLPDGYEHVLRWKPQHTPQTNMASGPGTVVLIGSLAPHKNIGLILGLAPQLAALGLRIAVVGTRDDRVFAKAEASHDVTNVIWLGRVSDDGLAALMRDSLCLCFPSLAEGFGLPALEAMAIGCPVICSDIASLREVCGDAALYASASDSSSWLSQLTRLRDDEMLHSHLSEKGPLRAKHFSWNETGRNYLRILSDLDAP